MSEEKHTCQGTSYPSEGSFRSFHGYICGKTANFEHEEKWYCKRHHPPSVKAKNDAKYAVYTAIREKEAAVRKRQADKQADVVRKAALFDELVAALKPFAHLVAFTPECPNAAVGSKGHLWADGKYIACGARYPNWKDSAKK